jgi:hypothetical protein
MLIIYRISYSPSPPQPLLLVLSGRFSPIVLGLLLALYDENFPTRYPRLVELTMGNALV